MEFESDSFSAREVGGGGVVVGNSTARKPKRVRRKCAHENCDNRVVQGGVCVTHGAKRKVCSFPDCDKAVKLAGYCSTHGPSRRKCGTAGCSRVAVQGGNCLSHGARRRVCCYPQSQGAGGGGGKCSKNAIMGGMCKKHYDRMQDAEGMLVMSLCVPVSSTTDYANYSGSDSGGSSGGSGSSVKSEGGEGRSVMDSPSWVGSNSCNGDVASSAANFC